MLTTEEKEILYGVCITRSEPVNTCRKVIDIFIQYKLYDTDNPQNYDVDVNLEALNELLESDTVVVAQQSYCFISKFPFFKLNFNVLKQILGMLFKLKPLLLA